MSRSVFWEEYEVGATRITHGRTITETDIVLHAGHTGDFMPHHMDAEWCKTQWFGQRIAHGNLVFCIAVGMSAGEINPEALSYGYDRLRFIRPVFIGDTIRARLTFTEKQEYNKRPEYGMLIERIEVLNQRDEVVVSCDHIHLIKRQGDGKAA